MLKHVETNNHLTAIKPFQRRLGLECDPRTFWAWFPRVNIMLFQSRVWSWDGYCSQGFMLDEQLVGKWPIRLSVIVKHHQQSPFGDDQCSLGDWFVSKQNIEGAYGQLDDVWNNEPGWTICSICFSNNQPQGGASYNLVYHPFGLIKPH